MGPNKLMLQFERLLPSLEQLFSSLMQEYRSH